MKKKNNLNKKPTMKTQLKEAKKLTNFATNRMNYYKEEFKILKIITLIILLVLIPLGFYAGWDMHDDLKSEGYIMTGYDNAMSQVNQELTRNCTGSITITMTSDSPKINYSCLEPKCKEWCEEDLATTSSYSYHKELNDQVRCEYNCIKEFEKDLKGEGEYTYSTIKKSGCIIWEEISNTQTQCTEYNYQITESNPAIQWANYVRYEWS